MGVNRMSGNYSLRKLSRETKWASSFPHWSLQSTYHRNFLPKVRLLLVERAGVQLAFIREFYLLLLLKQSKKNILPSCVHRVSPQGETHHLREQRQHGCLLCLRVCVSGGECWEPTSFGDNNRPMIFQNQVLCAFDKIILTDSHILRY